MDKQSTLIGRLHKLETYQSKLANFMDGIVLGGELPTEIKEGLKKPEVKEKIKAKIKRAESIKLKIALEIYNTISMQPFPPLNTISLTAG